MMPMTPLLRSLSLAILPACCFAIAVPLPAMGQDEVKEKEVQKEESKLIAAKAALDQFGEFAVSDGSSYYHFKKDGTFESGPMGISGRTMQGQWSFDRDVRLVARVQLGWINGFQPHEQYRRVAFHLGYLLKPGKERQLPTRGKATFLDSYFFIDEMVPITKEEAEAKPEATAETTGAGGGR